MAHRLTPEQEKAQDRTRRQMLLQEAALAAALLAVWRSARSPAEIRQGTARAVTVGRMAARVVATRAAQEQLEAIGLSLPAGVTVATSREAARALMVAESAAETWSKHHADAIAEGMVGAEATEAAKARSLWKVRQLSITETADTFSEQTSRVAARASGLGVRIYKVWDAVLDRRTCSVCAGSHGMAVPAESRFPEGEPGMVHPSCRCQAVIVTRDQVDPVVAQQGAQGADAMVVVHDDRRPGDRTAPAPAPRSRPRRVDALPLPPSGRAKSATFRPGRPPTKSEVTARQKAQRRAEFGGK